MKTNEFRQGIIHLLYFPIFIQIWSKPSCRAIASRLRIQIGEAATVLSVPKRWWLSRAVESPARPPPSSQLPNQLHCDMHSSPFFFPTYIKGYLLWHNLKAAVYTWQNSLLVSIFNYDKSNFWCSIQSAGGMLLIASTNDTGHTGQKMTPNAQWTEKNPAFLDLWKTSTTVIQSLDELPEKTFSFLLISQDARQPEFHAPSWAKPSLSMHTN